jgi:hypothetical protein
VLSAAEAAILVEDMTEMRDREGAARELAELCAGIRAAHPERVWQVKSAPVRIADPRIAFVLADYERGLATAAIAAKLGITRGALQTLVCRWRTAGLWPADVRGKMGRRRKG